MIVQNISFFLLKNNLFGVVHPQSDLVLFKRTSFSSHCMLCDEHARQLLSLASLDLKLSK